MRTVTVNVAEGMYELFQQAARKERRSTSDLIREAMEAYYRDKLEPHESLAELEPHSVGRIIRPITADDDLLDEMLGP